MSAFASLLHSAPALAATPAFLSGKFWSELGEVIARNKEEVQALAVVVAVVVVLFAQWYWRRKHRDFRVYRDEGGVATISPKALRHLIYLACEAVGTAGSPKICFRQNRGNVDVRIAVRLYQDQRLGEVHERLRQHIRAAFEQTHGIAMGEVSLKVTGFKKSRNEGGSTSADTTLLTPAAAGYGAADTTTLPDDDAGNDEAGQSASASEVTPLAGDAPVERGGRRWGIFGRRSEPAEATLGLEAGDETSAASESAKLPELAADGNSADASASGAFPEFGADDEAARNSGTK